jgi:hypothetical protein
MSEGSLDLVIDSLGLALDRHVQCHLRLYDAGDYDIEEMPAILLGKRVQFTAQKRSFVLTCHIEGLGSHYEFVAEWSRTPQLGVQANDWFSGLETDGVRNLKNG